MSLFHAPSVNKREKTTYPMSAVHGIALVAQLQHVEYDEDGRITMSVQVFPAQPTPVIDWIEDFNALDAIEVARLHGGDDGQVLKDVGITGPRRALVVMRPGLRPQPEAVGISYMVEGRKW